MCSHLASLPLTATYIPSHPTNSMGETENLESCLQYKSIPGHFSQTTDIHILSRYYANACSQFQFFMVCTTQFGQSLPSIP